MSSQTKALLSLVVVMLLATAMAWALSSGSLTIGGTPAIVWVFATAFIVQWLAFIPAFGLKTEKFFDLTGSLTYIACVLGAFLWVGRFDVRSLVVTLLVVGWAMRLGSFLFRRIQQDGKDSRFDDIKQSAIRFLNVWTLQGLWVSLTAATAFVVITAEQIFPADAFLYLGTLLWLVGFIIEVVADRQKSRFRQKPENKGQFVNQGLWAYSRHPNYVGEILLWLGVAVIALPVFNGWNVLALISPVFVYVLLTRVSGVPMLEASADKRWGNDPSYQQYKRQTPVLWPALIKK